MRPRVNIESYPFELHREIQMSCLNKCYYDTRELAESVAARRAAASPGLVLGIYCCKFCDLYHLSSQVGRYQLQAIGGKTVIDV